VDLLKLDHSEHQWAQTIADLLHAAYTAEAEIIGALAFPPLARTSEDIGASTSTFHGCVDRTLLVAVAELIRASDNSVEIVSFAVHPSVFRRGYGSALLIHILGFARGSTVSVATASANVPGVTFYKKHGFAPYEGWSTPDLVDMIRFKHRASA
jgi:N-acetylglutamate synthase-like GNAT family acetyltransferase